MNNFNKVVYSYLYNKYISTPYKSNLLEINSSILTTLIPSEQRKNVYITSYTMNYNNNNNKFKLDLTCNQAFNIIKNTSGLAFNTFICNKFNTFLKSQETLDNFLNILEYNSKTPDFKCIISLIDIPNLQDKYHIQDNKIIYFIKNSKKQGNFNSCKIFINGITNENQLDECVINTEYLLNYFKQHDYDCIESELYKNLYLQMGSLHLQQHEQDVLDLYKFYVLQKNKNTNNINTTINHSVKYISKHTLNSDENVLKYHRIYTLHNLLDVLNCYDYYYKNNYDDTTLNSNNLQNLKLKDSIYILNNENSNETNKGICIYTRLEINETELESTETENLYIVLHNNKILVSPNTIHLQNQKEIQEKNIEKNQEKNIKQEILSEINEIKSKSKKITLVKIKEYLKLLNAKTNGNKCELLDRLNLLLE
jgi:hypothetical protein